MPYVTAEAFTAEMEKAGNRCELVGYEGAGHAFFNVRQEYGRATVEGMVRFLRSLGYLEE